MSSYDYYYSSSSSNPTASIISLAITIISIVSLWKLFKKAGYQGWEAIIPIYNAVVLFKIAGLSPWLILLIFVPFANIYIIFKLYIELAHRFGKSTGYGVAMVFFSAIMLPIIAFDDNCVYLGQGNMNVNNQQMYNNQQTYNNQNMYNNQMNNNSQVMNNNQMNNNSQVMNNNQMYNQPTNNVQGLSSFCTNCGQKFNDSDTFCTRCGNKR